MAPARYKLMSPMVIKRPPMMGGRDGLVIQPLSEPLINQKVTSVITMSKKSSDVCLAKTGVINVKNKAVAIHIHPSATATGFIPALIMKNLARRLKEPASIMNPAKMKNKFPVVNS